MMQSLQVPSARSLFLSAFAAIFLPLISSAEDWQETKSPIANFSIQLPDEPEYSADTVDTELGELKLHMFLVEADAGNTAYMVMCTEYPDGAVGESVSNVFLWGTELSDTCIIAGETEEEFIHPYVRPKRYQPSSEYNKEDDLTYRKNEHRNHNE